MDHAARVVFIMAQCVCAQAELAAMHASNHARREQGMADAYGEDHFRGIQNDFLIGHNAVIDYLRD